MQIFARFAKGITGRSCLFSLPKTTQMLRIIYPKRMSKCSENCWIHRCQWNIKSTNCYFYWLIKHSLCCIHIFILVVVRLLDTHEELWPLSCYGPDKDSTIFVVISLQRICGYLALREKMAIECENLYTVVTSLWSIRWRR